MHKYPLKYPIYFPIEKGPCVCVFALHVQAPHKQATQHAVDSTVSLPRR